MKHCSNRGPKLMKINMELKRFLPIFILLSLVFVCPQLVTAQKVRKVVIDAGHGGHDPGAVGRISKEKDITLSIALKTGKYIEENLSDVEVIYTRKTDVFVELYKRAKIANEAKADLFISIHCNANKSSSPYGAETYVMGLHKSEANLAVAQLENAAILLEEDYHVKYDGFDPNSPEGNIFFSMLQNAYLDQSLYLASNVQKHFKDRVNLFDRGVKQAGFLVLYKTTMPSVLIETGFISNSKEEKLLASDEGQNYIASAIFRAIKDYKKSFEKPAPLLAQKDITPEILVTDQKINATPTVSKETQKEPSEPKTSEVMVSGKNNSTVKPIEPKKKEVKPTQSKSSGAVKPELKIAKEKSTITESEKPSQIKPAEAKKEETTKAVSIELNKPADIRSPIDAENKLVIADPSTSESNIAELHNMPDTENDSVILKELQKTEPKTLKMEQDKDATELIKTINNDVVIKPANTEDLQTISKSDILAVDDKLSTDNIAENDNGETKETKENAHESVNIRSKVDSSVKKEEETLIDIDKPSGQSVVFKVQFLASKALLDMSSSEFKGLRNVSHYFHNGIYKYTYGNEVSYERATMLAKEIDIIGFNDCFIVAFKNNERISIEEAIRLQGK